MVDFVGSDIHHLNHLKMFSKKITIKNINFLKIAINKTKDYFENLFIAILVSVVIAVFIEYK